MTLAGVPPGCAPAFAWGCVHGDRAWPASYRAPVPIRVVIADDNLLVREGLAQVLAEQQNIELVGAYADLPSHVSKRVKGTLAFLSEEREAGDARPTGACP